MPGKINAGGAKGKAQKLYVLLGKLNHKADWTVVARAVVSGFSSRKKH